MSIHSIPSTSPLPARAGLPRVILRYITAANDGRIDDAAACFAEDALVHDEHQDHRGFEAIRNWIAGTTESSQPQNEVLSAAEEGGTHHVRSKISGNFPGSPVELELDFVLVDEKISRLTIQ